LPTGLGVPMANLDWQDYAPGDHRVSCPECGTKASIKNAGLRVDHDGALLHCFKCGLVETYREKQYAVRRAPTIKPAQHHVQQHTELSPWGRELWASTRELSGVAVDYLRHRRCVVPPAYGALRWHPALKHPGGHIGPCLVALVTHVHTDTPLSLHRTWIAPTGKADVHPPRLQLAGHTLRCGAIKLWPAEDVGHTLGIAEGIESALSMAHAVQPVWSCIDAGHMTELPVLEGVTQLYIAQDDDPAGRKAGTACATRWHAAGCRVEVSTQQKNDLNDVLEAA